MAKFYFIPVNTPDEHNCYGPFTDPYAAQHAVHVLADRQKSCEITSSTPSRVFLRTPEGETLLICSRLFQSVQQRKIDAMMKRLIPFK